MRLEIAADIGADNVDFSMMFSRPLECRLGKRSRYTATPQGFRNLGFEQCEYVAVEGVIERGDDSVALQLESAALNAFRNLLFVFEPAHCRASVASVLAARKCSRIACACDFVTTAESAATSACFTAFKLPKCSSSRRVVDLPTPGISRSSVERSRIWRR